MSKNLGSCDYELWRAVVSTLSSHSFLSRLGTEDMSLANFKGVLADVESYIIQHQLAESLKVLEEA